MITTTFTPVTSDEPPSLTDLVHPDVARLHFGTRSLSADGVFDLRGGSGFRVRLLSSFLRLPPPARAVRLKLHIERDSQHEMWHRSFGGRSLDAWFERTPSGEMIEVFGPLRLQYRMRASSGALVLELRSANIRLGSMSLRLPRWAAPKVRARAWVRDDDGCVHAFIAVLAPWGDLLLAYRGHLEGAQSWTS